MCVRRQAPVSLATAPRRELPKSTITMRPQATGPQWAPKELKIVLTLFKNGFHSHPNAPKSVGGWGSAPDPPPPKKARESAFDACQSDTPRGRGANSHLRPGRQKPSVCHWRNQELDLGRWPKVALRWNFIHGVAELNQVLWCMTSQAIARDGVELELSTLLNWEPVELPSYCSRDWIVFANCKDQTCSRIKDRLETVKEVYSTCPREKAIWDIDEGMDQGLDSRWRECRTARIWRSWLLYTIYSNLSVTNSYCSCCGLTLSSSHSYAVIRWFLLRNYSILSALTFEYTKQSNTLHPITK